MSDYGLAQAILDDSSEEDYQPAERRVDEDSSYDDDEINIFQTFNPTMANEEDQEDFHSSEAESGRDSPMEQDSDSSDDDVKPELKPVNSKLTSKSKKRAREESDFSSDDQVSEDNSSEEDDTPSPSSSSSTSSKSSKRKLASPFGLPPIKTAPSTIAFDDNRSQPKPTTSSLDFHSPQFGALACLFAPTAWNVRLLGKITLTLEFTEELRSEKDQINIWKKLIKPIKPTKTHTRLYAKNTGVKGGVVAGIKTWNKKGEPGSNGIPVLTIGRIFELIVTDQIRCETLEMEAAVHALTSLTTPSAKVYNAPMIRTLCRKILPLTKKSNKNNSNKKSNKKSKTSSASSNASSNASSTSFQVECHVYASRLLFYLIAFEPFRAIMNLLVPCKNSAKCIRPRYKNPIQQPVKFLRSTQSNATKPSLYSSNNNESQNDLPNGWQQIASNKKPGKFFYYNPNTKQKQWKRPKDEQNSSSSSSAPSSSTSTSTTSSSSTSSTSTSSTSFSSSSLITTSLEDPFTLSAMLRSQEHTGYVEAIQPLGLALQMKDYQKQSLQWMIVGLVFCLTLTQLPFSRTNITFSFFCYIIN